MNILLLGGLPEDYDGIPISADFRNMIQVALLLNDPEISQEEKAVAALYQLYPEMPKDREKAAQGLVWFYTRGNIPQESESTGAGEAAKRAFDFEQDANLIYAAFYATYGICLSTVEFLHWWEFMALFEGLPDTTLIKRVMYWRTADTSGMSKQERKHIQHMRRLFALKESGAPPVSIDELNQRTKDRISRRFAEAQTARDAQKLATSKYTL